LAAQRELPNNWREELAGWKCKFMDSIIKLDITEPKRIKLPHIFLAILKHFLSMIGSNSNDQDYNPLKYLEILYTHQNYDEDPHPLKIYDPVKDKLPNSPKESPTIINFCETLNILYSRRENLKLNEFVKFHFQGKGLLQGQKQKPNDEKRKILAYCGKCGYPHIIRNEEPGKDNICKICKRNKRDFLICPKCQYCRSEWLENNQGKNIKIDYCPGYIERTEKKPVDILGLNVVNLVGRVGKDPDVKYCEDGKIRYCNLSLAVNHRIKNDDKPDWFNLMIWGKTAEIAAKDVRKGSLIAIQGALIFDTWIDTKTETHRSKPVIQVEELYIYK
ncbi:single-stranded DNA-binding protein, partial [Nodularia sp. UHCC 0506]|uniref:single-stranded DNA-binding protein n=1 Tax=Nodularia sp. UHCC 0506 TaxID=3110243 RepID=UPI002B216A31